MFGLGADVLCASYRGYSVQTYLDMLLDHRIVIRSMPLLYPAVKKIFDGISGILKAV